MVAFYYSTKVAFVKGTPNTVAANATVLVYDTTDTGYTTPLTAYSDPALTTIVNLVSDAYGIVPDFYTDNKANILWKSGTMKGQWGTDTSRAGERGPTGAPGADGADGQQGPPGVDGAGTNAEVAAYVTASGETRDALDSRYPTKSAITAAAYVPAWQPSTAYAAGQRVAAPSGDIVSAKVAFTSGATYSVSDWNASTQDGRVVSLEAWQNARANLMYSLIYGPQPSTSSLTTVRGTPTFTAGKFGNAAKGGVAVFSAGSVNPEPAGSLTIECWFNNAVIPPSGAIDIIWGFNNAPYLGIEAVTGKAWFSAAGNGTTDVKSSGSICDGSWHHLAVELRRTSGATELVGFWIDGTLVSGTFSPHVAAWNSTVTIRGRIATGYDLQDTAAVDELRIRSGSHYSGSFVPPTLPFAWDSATVLLAHLDDVAMLTTANDYDQRPASAPGGSVTYTGPVEPTTWLTNDRWVRV